MLQGEQQQQQAEAQQQPLQSVSGKGGEGMDMGVPKMARVGISVRQNLTRVPTRCVFDDLHRLLRFVTFIHSHGIVRG